MTTSERTYADLSNEQHCECCDRVASGCTASDGLVYCSEHMPLVIVQSDARYFNQWSGYESGCGQWVVYQQQATRFTMNTVKSALNFLKGHGSPSARIIAG